MIVGARWAGLSMYVIPVLLGFSCITESRVSSDKCVKQKKNTVSGSFADRNVLLLWQERGEWSELTGRLR